MAPAEAAEVAQTLTEAARRASERKTGSLATRPTPTTHTAPHTKRGSQPGATGERRGLVKEPNMPTNSPAAALRRPRLTSCPPQAGGRDPGGALVSRNGLAPSRDTSALAREDLSDSADTGRFRRKEIQTSGGRERSGGIFQRLVSRGGVLTHGSDPKLPREATVAGHHPRQRDGSAAASTGRRGER